MITEINKIVGWEEIEKIKEMAKKDVIIVRMPKSVYNHKKMKYKIEALKEIPTVVINVEEKQRGRKKKIQNDILEKAIELINNNYSIRETANELGIPKSTLWLYIKDIAKNAKIRLFKKLVLEYKEQLIKKGLYNGTIDMLFAELEMHLKLNDLEKAKNILTEIIMYVNDDLDEDDEEEY